MTRHDGNTNMLRCDIAKVCDRNLKALRTEVPKQRYDKICQRVIRTPESKRVEFGPIVLKVIFNDSSWHNIQNIA